MTTMLNTSRQRIGLGALLGAMSVVALGLGWWLSVERVIEDTRSQQAAERAAAEAALQARRDTYLAERPARIQQMEEQLRDPTFNPRDREAMRDKLARLRSEVAAEGE
jgi:hypothetical protein